MYSLEQFRFRKRFCAACGGQGAGNGKKGKDGQDCIIFVPLGTIVRDADTGLLVRDFDRPERSVTVAKGGIGGRGNAKGGLASQGQQGQSLRLSLELKLFTDIGIIGPPNVGKSMLLSKITKARPQVADFAFTTKVPVLGQAQGRGDFTFLVAELPGIIRGSHKGKGLGIGFLRHLERAKVLVHLVDMSRQFDNLLEDYWNVIEELSLFNKKLLEKSKVVAANKMDLPQAQENLERFRNRVKEPVFCISALKGDGLPELIEILADRIKKTGHQELHVERTYGRI
jgi:GTP-binding protein